MPSMKDIKQRISNVGTTRQIIRAMDMVAATKLHKARARLEGVRPLQREMQERLALLSRCEEGAQHPFAPRRNVKNVAYLVITSNKGLCGGYNANVSEKALAHMRQGKKQGRNEKIIVAGNKGYEFFRSHHKNILHRIHDIHESQIYGAAGKAGELIASLYLSAEVDEVYMAYTYFESTLSHTPRLERVLPLPLGQGGGQRGGEMKYEPDVHTFIDHFAPLYLHTYFFAASCESLACEYAARMVNMDSAGKNAAEVIEDLKHLYNRKRQASITQELNEIVGGAKILE